MQLQDNHGTVGCGIGLLQPPLSSFVGIVGVAKASSSHVGFN